VQAFVLEQDRDLVLDAEPELVLREPRESVASLLATAARTQGHPIGSVLVTGSAIPYCFLAIVHDLAEDPSWKEAWVAAALETVLAEAERRGLEAIAMPLLGTVYGRLPAHRSIELLADAVGRTTRLTLRDIWLPTPKGFERGLLQPLADAGCDVVTPASRM
jgi:hypothetical protein